MSDDLYLRPVSRGHRLLVMFVEPSLLQSFEAELKRKECTEHSDSKLAKNGAPTEAKARLDRVVIINQS